MKADERLLIQQGSVDWFDFWLNGYVDPDPAKKEQYKRWARLREFQKSSEADAIKARKWRHEEKARKAAMKAWAETPEGEAAIQKAKRAAH